MSPVRVPRIPAPTPEDDFGNMTEKEIRLYREFVVKQLVHHKYAFCNGMKEEQKKHVVARVQSPIAYVPTPTLRATSGIALHVIPPLEELPTNKYKKKHIIRNNMFSMSEIS